MIVDSSWNADETLFFTLRRLVPRMGIDNLIKAMALLKSKGYRCRLVIGGAGPERERLEQLTRSIDMESSVVFLGKIPDADLPAFFQAADCFVLPTRALECFGLIILESFASGTPVIATPVGSIPEIMGEVGNSFLTDDAQPESLARKMAAFMDKELDYDEAAF